MQNILGPYNDSLRGNVANAHQIVTMGLDVLMPPDVFLTDDDYKTFRSLMTGIRNRLTEALQQIG